MVEWEAVGTIVVFVVLINVIILYLQSVEPPYFRPISSLHKCYTGEVAKKEFIGSLISGCAGNYTLSEPVSYYEIEEAANYTGMTAALDRECISKADIVVSKPILNGKVSAIEFEGQIKVC
ncbi:MAG: hypothetical protein QW035_03115 [Candidatus Anstonellales archaeon]